MKERKFKMSNERNAGTSGMDVVGIYGTSGSYGTTGIAGTSGTGGLYKSKAQIIREERIRKLDQIEVIVIDKKIEEMKSV